MERNEFAVTRRELLKLSAAAGLGAAGLPATAWAAATDSKDTIVISKSDRGPTRGRQIAERLKGRGDVTMTTDEIMAFTRGI